MLIIEDMVIIELHRQFVTHSRTVPQVARGTGNLRHCP